MQSQNKHESVSKSGRMYTDRTYMATTWVDISVHSKASYRHLEHGVQTLTLEIFTGLLHAPLTACTTTQVLVSHPNQLRV